MSNQQEKSLRIAYINSMSQTLVLKLAGSQCNIDCDYCFEKQKNILASPKIMDTEIECIVNASLYPVEVVLHGGEPLLVGVDGVRLILAKLRELGEKIKAVSMQTNGTLLTDEWLDLLFTEYADLRIDIAVSIDGTENMNRHRTSYSGENTFVKVMDGLRMLEKRSIRAGILTVVSRSSLGHVNDYASFIRTIPNISFLKINPLFDIIGNVLALGSITPSEYVEFVCAFSERYIAEKEYARYAAEPVLSCLQRINGHPSRFCNFSPRKCASFTSVYPGGKATMCDTLPGQTFPVSIASGENLGQAVLRALDSHAGQQLEKLVLACQNCKIQDFCQGGCLAHRYAFSENAKLSQEYCASRHELLHFFKRFIV